MSKIAKKIVWIEDDTNIINDVVRPLERSGFQIERFYTVKEALDNVDALQACGGNVQFTVFPDIGHDVDHSQVYTDELYEWLLNQTR